jgi:hypothetical protein
MSSIKARRISSQERAVSFGRASGKRPDPSACDKGDLRKTPGVEIINALSDAVEEVLWREQILGIVMVVTINVERRG